MLDCSQNGPQHASERHIQRSYKFGLFIGIRFEILNMPSPHLNYPKHNIAFSIRKTSYGISQKHFIVSRILTVDSPVRQPYPRGRPSCTYPKWFTQFNSVYLSVHPAYGRSATALSQSSITEIEHNISHSVLSTLQLPLQSYTMSDTKSIPEYTGVPFIKARHHACAIVTTHPVHFCGGGNIPFVLLWQRDRTDDTHRSKN